MLYPGDSTSITFVLDTLRPIAATRDPDEMLEVALHIEALEVNQMWIEVALDLAVESETIQWALKQIDPS